MLPFLAGLLGFGADLVVPGATIAAEAAPEIAAGAAAAGEAAGAAGARHRTRRAAPRRRSRRGPWYRLRS